MLIFDQLKKSDPQLRFIAAVVLTGLGVLLGGLWYYQIIASRRYVTSLNNQSFRTVRVPAIRGKIVDRNGVSLAENRPSYNVNLYFDELRESFQQEFRLTRPPGVLKRDQIAAHARASRYSVVHQIVQRVGLAVNQPIFLDEAKFHQHYEQRLALPYTLLSDLNLTQIARIQERAGEIPGLVMEIQPTRVYPFHVAAHVLGFLKNDSSSKEGEDASFNYYLPDYKGVVGIEATFDGELRGKAGVKSVLVNNLGYRQSETIWQPAEAGKNVVLTVDLPLQIATEKALHDAGQNLRGAAIVLDANSGDVLALASAPTYDPNGFLPSVTPQEWERLNDPKQRPMINRATHEIYAPGSIFKIVIALAALGRGLDPKEIYEVEPQPGDSSHGCIFVGRRRIDDTAPPGKYDFRRAFLKSSNAYFVNCGLDAGLDAIIAIGQRLHLGERVRLPLLQESSGILPTPQWIKNERGGWSPGDTANLCIGQGDLAVTPMQMAVMTAAIANGGKVYWPRIVDRIEPQDPASGEAVHHFPAAQVRNDLGVPPRVVELIHDAMYADTDDPEATAFKAFHPHGANKPLLPDMRIGGKTGTAQVMQGRKVVDHITWFVSFTEYQGNTFAVVVMVESGGSGGGTCAPVAAKIFQAIHDRNNKPIIPRTRPLAAANRG